MHELQNVLYVQTEGTTLRLEHEALRVMRDGAMVARFPLLGLSGVVVFGGVHVTSSLIHRCAEDGRSLVWLSRTGRFRARLQGATRGNVLLRREQHLALSDECHTVAIARQMVAGKIQNTRQSLLRSARDVASDGDRGMLQSVGVDLERGLAGLQRTLDLDVIRGIEGEAARRYFAALPRLLVPERRDWCIGGRSRRPPRDRVNAVLSFLYALLRAECESALEGVGLDPQVGYLHALRPGRPALALDLMEELRPLSDRVAITLVNRRQLDDRDFEVAPGGAVYLTDRGRKSVITAWQKRKQVEVAHRVLNTRLPIGLVPHVQARLLARHLRADLDHYPPFLHR